MSVARGLCLGHAWKGRCSTWKEGPLECGVPESGCRALSEGVWMGFRPSSWEGVSEGRGGALGGGVGVGLGLCTAGGRLRGQRIRPGSPTGFPAPKWTGKALTSFPSVPSRSPHRLLQGLPHPRWTPNCGWVPLGVGTPSLPQPPLRGAVLEVRPLLLLPFPSLPLPQDPRSWQGPRWAENQARYLNGFLGVQLSCLLLDYENIFYYSIFLLHVLVTHSYNSSFSGYPRDYNMPS